MKKITTILFISVILAGCSLKEKVTSYSTVETYYTSPAAIQSGLNGCYLPLRQTLGASDFFFFTEVSSDVMYLNNSSYYTAICDYSSTKPSVVRTFWQRLYVTVMRANSVLAAIDRSVAQGYITEKEAAQYKAEGAILRSFGYYLLTSIYGDVPFYTEEVTEENRLAIGDLPRMSATATRDYCIDELMEYLMPLRHATHPGNQVLPLQRTYDNESYRMGAAVGLTLAGKMAMWNERWEDAIAIFGVLEDIYGLGAGNDPQSALARYPLTDIPYCRKYTPESIFEIAYSYEPYGVQVAGNLASFTLPSRSTVTVTGTGEDDQEEEFIVSDVYNGISIPELGNQAKLALTVRPTKYYYQNLMSYSSGDLRRAKYDSGGNELASSGNLAWQWMGYDPATDPEHLYGRKLLYFTSTAKSSGRPFLGNKFWCYNMIYNNDSNNPKIFRYAGTILDLAECYARVGDFDKSTQYVNAVRSRSGLASLDVFGSLDEAIDAVLDESARELYGEYQRRFTLVRCGVWYEKVLERTDSPLLKMYIRPYKKYFPIPEDQITYSHGALDNNDYKD